MTTYDHFRNGTKVGETTVNHRSDGSVKVFEKEVHSGSLGLDVKHVVSVTTIDKDGNSHVDDRR